MNATHIYQFPNGRQKGNNESERSNRCIHHTLVCVSLCVRMRRRDQRQDITHRIPNRMECDYVCVCLNQMEFIFIENSRRMPSEHCAIHCFQSIYCSSNPQICCVFSQMQRDDSDHCEGKNHLIASVSGVSLCIRIHFQCMCAQSNKTKANSLHKKPKSGKNQQRFLIWIFFFEIFWCFFVDVPANLVEIVGRFRNRAIWSLHIPEWARFL